MEDEPEVIKYNLSYSTLYNALFEFLEENSNDDISYFKNIINLIQTTQYERNPEEFELFLRMLVSFSDNYHREEDLYGKIKRIILYYQDIIKNNFSEDDIFDIFKNNKILLHFIFEKEIVHPDYHQIQKIIIESKLTGTLNYYYFYNYIAKVVDEKQIKSMESEITSYDSNIFENFDQKCQKGQNDSHICSLIRDDSVEEFISYTSLTNYPLSSFVKPSIFETNSFLLENENTTLIEYSAFFGAIQIFKYLQYNNVKLTSSLWLYAIHSNNAEMILLLEENQIEPPNKSYVSIIKEAYKCHHNKIALYIINNYLADWMKDDVISCFYKYYNFDFIITQRILEDESLYNLVFFYLDFYGYHSFVKLFIKQKEQEFKSIAISNNIYF